jgi:hypothetical protein
MAFRFLTTNRYTASATVLTASSSATALPIGASQNIDRNYVWRSSTGTGTPTVDIDLGSVIALTMVGVANVKLVGTGVLEFYHRGDSGSPGAATLVATLGTQDTDTRVAVAFFASASHRHWQLKWTNPTAASDYAELGFAGLGTYVELARNIQTPQILRMDPSTGASSVDGQQTFAIRTGFCYGDWAWRGIRESTDIASLRTLYRTVGRHTPFFAVLDSAKTWTAWLVRLTSPVVVAPINTPASDWWTDASISWEEAR